MFDMLYNYPFSNKFAVISQGLWSLTKMTLFIDQYSFIKQTLYSTQQWRIDGCDKSSSKEKEYPPSVSDTNITITPSVTRTTSLDSVNHKIVTIDPTSNLAGATSYTVTMTTNLRGLYSPWTVQPPTTESISFTTV